MNRDLLALQCRLQDERQPYAVATVVEVLGSSSAKTASKALIDGQGHVMAGWVGGGCAQNLVVQTALACLHSGETRMVDIDLNDEVFGAGMPCGGKMRVYVEPVLPKPMLWLMGHGRIVETVCEFAEKVHFDITVIDSQADPLRLPAASRVITEHGRYDALKPKRGDFVIIASQHKGDYDSLTRALDSDAAYIALVASRQRAALVLKRLSREGLAAERLAHVRSPAGLDLGARLPEEIALAIVAEMVQVRRGGSGNSLSGSAAFNP